LTGSSENEQELHERMDEEVNRLKALIPEYVFGEGEDTLEAIIGKLLLEKGRTLVTAESCTGGYIAHLVTSIPGSSGYYLGSVVAYSNEIKVRELEVKLEDILHYGAVSEEVVRQMADGIKKRSGSDYAIATSGIAGPDGGTEDKPVGLVWIAIAGHSGTSAFKYMFGDSRERNIRRTALQALNLLRKTIISDAL
jgi:nicotinamide-nucleotide amidase